MIKVKENEMGWSCSAYGRVEKYLKTFAWKSCKEEATRNTWSKRKDNIKIDLSVAGFWRVDWVHLAQDRDRRSTLANTIRDLRNPQNGKNLLISRALINAFSRMSAPWNKFTVLFRGMCNSCVP
jgi:hypothetical protein